MWLDLLQIAIWLTACGFWAYTGYHAGKLNVLRRWAKSLDGDRVCTPLTHISGTSSIGPTPFPLSCVCGAISFEVKAVSSV